MKVCYDRIVNTGCQQNFLRFRTDLVRVKVELLKNYKIKHVKKLRQ